jgi:ParB family chromosome partitioning protein
MWDGHARLEEHINEETCRDEIESFTLHGQKIPVLARPYKSDTTHDFELIYGARRLFVARLLNVPLLLESKELTDREATVALDIENRQRKELSPYERGRSYQAWLRAGIFSSQDELARALNLSNSQVSRLLRLAQLPSVVVGAFASPVDICENWGRMLVDIWKDPPKQRALTAAARAIAKEPEPLPAPTVFRRLIAAPNGSDPRRGSAQSDSHDEVVKDAQGNPLFRIRHHRRDTALLLPTMSVPAHVLSAIKDEVAGILHRANSETVDFTKQHTRARPDVPRRGTRVDPNGTAELRL